MVKQLLYNVSQLSISELSLKEYLGAIHNEVRKIMKADNFYIALYDKNTDKYTLPYHVDEYDDLTTDEPVSLNHTLTDYIRKSGQAELLTEETDRRLREKEKIRMIGTPSPVWIGAPVKDTSTNEVTGVIALQDYEDKNAYNKDDLHTLSIIATNIGTFIERINNLQNLKKAKEKAEESDRLKTAFLANMSHEIRTPMNGILGFTNLLMDPDLTGEEKDQYIEIIHKSGQRMMSTVSDIVEISKIEAGIISIQYATTNANKIVKELVNFFRSEAQKKGLTLTLDKLLPESDSTLHTDQNKFESVLSNLIKNAIKYTDSGSINAGCQVNDGFAEFYVKDTGIGVPQKRQEAIFNRFEQADISDTRAFEGSGL
ncbi:MAG: GAF domain-containing sensor histidine kinase, partial [Bacteroidota bacterium]